MRWEEDGDDGSVTEIPLPNVKSQVLTKVIEFCTHHLQEPMSEIEKPLKSAVMADVVQKWYADFVNLEQVLLFELILAANYMDIKPLLDLTCATVASMIKGKTVCFFFIILSVAGFAVENLTLLCFPAGGNSRHFQHPERLYVSELKMTALVATVTRTHTSAPPSSWFLLLFQPRGRATGARREQVVRGSIIVSLVFLPCFV